MVALLVAAVLVATPPMVAVSAVVITEKDHDQEVCGNIERVFY